ncbi:hypothetical protein HYS92_02145 [Candidatus Daviesbacteria bacterium]|nr:hypothetical protein [Candidatus Daviesbacteria bacterium]
MDKKARSILLKTLVFIFSISLAWFLVKSGYLHSWVETVLPHQFIGEFIAGALYTSFLTSPIAVAMFLVIAQESNPIIIALVGGLGAACGDILIIKLFRDNYKNDVDNVSKQLHLKRISIFLRLFHFEFIIPVIGAIIIASPFPDEIGLLMLGVSRLKYGEIAKISFVLNSAGILLIAAPINLLT